MSSFPLTRARRGSLEQTLESSPGARWRVVASQRSAAQCIAGPRAGQPKQAQVPSIASIDGPAESLLLLLLLLATTPAAGAGGRNWLGEW